MKASEELLGELRIPHDRSENVVEVVSNASGECSDRFHFLRVPELRLQLLLAAMNKDPFEFGRRSGGEDLENGVRLLGLSEWLVVDDSEDPDARFTIEENSAFADNNVLIAARFFDLVRIDKESASADRVLKKAAKKAPCLAFVRVTFALETVQAGKFRSKAIYAAMGETISADYTCKLSGIVSKQTKIQKQRAKLDKDYAKINRLDEKIGDEESDRRRAKLEKERDALATKLNEAEGKLTDREIKLYELAPKEKSTA